MSFRHNSSVADREPSWGDVDKAKLPRIAHADMGTPDEKGTWKYPHHWIAGGRSPDAKGVYTSGTMYLHNGGLRAAWAAAMGARTGRRASAGIIRHLRRHRDALGLEKDGGLFDELEYYDGGEHVPGDELSKPFPNEHSARLRDPGEFDPDAYRRTKGGRLFNRVNVPSTISIIWGKLRGASAPSDPPIPQALRFPTTNWTVDAAKAWLRENDIRHIKFEPAEAAKSDEIEHSQQNDENGAYMVLEREKMEKSDRFVSFLSKDNAKRLVYGVVYEPNKVDGQNDFACAEEIEKAAHRFMLDWQKIGVMHARETRDVRLVESYIAPADFRMDGEPVTKGAWIIAVKVENDSVWNAILTGELNGFSLQGYGRGKDE
jgi:hypothetical protein